MSPADVLRDPRVSPAIAWLALTKLLGPTVDEWEPDAIALDLERHGVTPAAGLMTKLLGAQTVLATGAVTHDHEAFFAFALACDGVAHGYDEFAHPTAAQLAWAVHQVEAIAKKRLTDEEGFDPDEIDPAVAVLLFEEGFFLAPRELDFAQDYLERMTHAPPEKVAAARKVRDKLDELPDNDLRRLASDAPETMLGVQTRRLADVLVHVREQAAHDAALRRELDLTAR